MKDIIYIMVNDDEVILYLIKFCHIILYYIMLYNVILYYIIFYFLYSSARIQATLVAVWITGLKLGG